MTQPLRFVTPIERLRVAAGLSQQEAARALGIDRRSLYAYENRLREPHAKIIAKLARYFEVDAGELLEEIRAFNREHEAAA